MKENPLGKTTNYQFQYDPALLYPIPRELSRKAIGVSGEEFFGYDIWNAYELSWLNPKGKPEARILKLVYSSDSPFIVESKSFKLYLNSFIMSPFDSEEEVLNRIEGDMNSLLKPSFLQASLYSSNTQSFDVTSIPEEQLLDHLDVSVSSYEPDTGLLKTGSGPGGTVERFTNLFKSNCPVTGQPDWASISVKYKAETPLDDASLLRYLISYRNHSGYHESCCEQIFKDLEAVLHPDLLTVKCFFTRRGGIDINPMRSRGEVLTPEDFHYFRQ
jgi:7-cyano-7-deazaguanine reductase